MNVKDGTARRTWLWLPIFVLFTLHNLEEIAFDLPAWGRAHGFDLPTTALDQSGFALVVAALSAALFTLAFALRLRPRATRATLLAFLGVMVLNFLMHIAASIRTLSVQPGVITAIVLLPVYAWLIRKVWREWNGRSDA